MKKIYLLMVYLLLIPTLVWSQADVKITDLPEATSAVTADIVPVVVNMATTPVTKYMTFGNMVVSLMSAKSITWDGLNVTFPGSVASASVDGSNGWTFTPNTAGHDRVPAAGEYSIYVNNDGWHFGVNGVQKTPAIPDEVIKTTSGTLTALEVSYSIVNNYGQGVTTNNIQTLPTAVKGLHFKGIIGTLVNSTYYFEFLRAGTNVIYFADVTSGTVNTNKTYVRATQQNIGSAIECDTFQIGTSTWAWFCKALSGIWTTD